MNIAHYRVYFETPSPLPSCIRSFTRDETKLFAVARGCKNYPRDRSDVHSKKICWGKEENSDRTLRVHARARAHATRSDAWGLVAPLSGLHHHFYSILADINEFASSVPGLRASSRSKYYAHNRALYNPGEAGLE